MKAGPAYAVKPEHRHSEKVVQYYISSGTSQEKIGQSPNAHATFTQASRELSQRAGDMDVADYAESTGCINALALKGHATGIYIPLSFRTPKG